jgi:uncharacterized protein (TIGR02145 family)
MFRLVGFFLIAVFIFACSESESSADALKDYFDNLSFADSENESSSSFSGLSPDSVVTGEFKDARDNRTYKTVKIGNQTWMAENLKYSLDSLVESWCYEDDNSNCEKYGRLYSWMTAIGKSDEECGYQKACSLTYPVQGICPEGWHIPSKYELATLVENAGGPSIAGARLKAKEGWEPAWNECTGTDDYHFSAMASGYLRVYTDHYYNKGYHTGIWSSTEVEDFHRAEQYQHIDVYILFLDYDKDTAQVSDTNRDFAESVRCLKDDSEK